MRHLRRAVRDTAITPRAWIVAVLAGDAQNFAPEIGAGDAVGDPGFEGLADSHSLADVQIVGSGAPGALVAGCFVDEALGVPGCGAETSDCVGLVAGGAAAALALCTVFPTGVGSLGQHEEGDDREGCSESLSCWSSHFLTGLG